MLDATQQIIEKKLKFMLLPDINDIEHISDYAKNIYKYQIQCLGLRTLRELELLKVVIRKYIQKVSTSVNAEIYRRFEKPRRKSTTRIDRTIQEVTNWLGFYKYTQDVCIEKQKEEEINSTPQNEQIKQTIKKIAALPLCSGYISVNTPDFKNAYIFGSKEEIKEYCQEVMNETHTNKIGKIYKAITELNEETKKVTILNSEQENKNIKKQSNIEYDLKRMRRAFAEEVQTNDRMERNYVCIIKMLLDDIQTETSEERLIYVIIFNGKDIQQY